MSYQLEYINTVVRKKPANFAVWGYHYAPKRDTAKLIQQSIPVQKMLNEIT